MASVKKATRTMRSREDHDLFKISYPHYDPQAVRSIQLHLGPGQYLRPGGIIATVYLRKSEGEGLQSRGEGDQSFPLTSYVAGKVEKLGVGFSADQTGWRLEQPLKKSALELVHIRQCEHIMNIQSITNSEIASKTENSAPCDICPNCGKQIWIYYHYEEETITVQALLAANSHIQSDELKQLEWSIILNEQFTPNTAIAKVGNKEINLPILAKATFLIGEGQKPLNNVVMKIRRVICKHEKIIGNRCQICLQIIDYSQMEQFTRYLFQFGPNGIGRSIAKGSALLHQEQEYINNLLSKRRLILILDLDNTILHSNEMSEIELKDVLNLRDFFLIPKFQPSPEGKMRQDYIIIKMRPYLKEFLFIIGRMFQVYIYTKGTRVYADSICRWVRNQWAGQPAPYDINTWSDPPLTFLKNTQCFAPHRVISRNEDTNLDSKSMQNILPTRTEYHLILDDRRDVWSNSPSWFFTREYYCFFKKKRNPNEISQSIEHLIGNQENQNYLPYVTKLIDCYNHMRQYFLQKSEFQVQVSHKPDYFLLFAAHALRKIHNYFFDQFNKPKEEKNQLPIGEKSKDQKKALLSLSYLLQKIRQFLKGKHVKFFTAPNDESLSTARRALKLGATVLTKKDSVKPDYVIRGNSYMQFVKKCRSEHVGQKKQRAPKDKQQEATIPKIQIQRQIHRPKYQDPQKYIQQKVDRIFAQLKAQVIAEAQTYQKNRSDKQLQKQIKQPKADYESQLRQLEELHKKGTPVISETWILACYQFTYKFKFQGFRLQDPFKEDVQHSQFDICIAKAAEKIRVEINEHINKGASSSQTDKKKKKQKKETKQNEAQKQKEVAEQVMEVQKIQSQDVNQIAQNLSSKMKLSQPNGK